MPKMNPAAHKLAGTRIDGGRLELVSILGSGAYGVVYLALDTASPPDDPAWYAVKCLTKEGLDARQRKFQRREIALHQLASAHPGVVSLHRVVEESQWVFVVLDFCPDGDLFTMITEHSLYLGNDALIKDVFLQLVSAVEYCHTMGIYHRDLKPENILCQEGGMKLLLADFGLATSEKTSEAFGCGSSFYMSPECQGGISVRNVPYAPSANDVWALGIILVNLTCGRNPWKQATLDDDTFRAYLSDPNFLPRILPVSPQLNDILKRVFAINPNARMTLAELRVAISRIKSFTMSEKELMYAHPAVRKVVVQQRIPVAPASITTSRPAPICPYPSKPYSRPANVITTLVSHLVRPTSSNSPPQLNSNSAGFPPLEPPSFHARTSGASSATTGSDGSLIMTPEGALAPVPEDAMLAVVPDGALDGEWAVEVTSPTKLRIQPPTKETQKEGSVLGGLSGRSFFRDVVRRIKAL